MAQTGDNLKKVQSGEPLRVSAATFNSFVDATLAIKRIEQAGRGPGQYVPEMLRSTVVWIKNNSDSDREAMEVLGIDSPVFGPDDNENEFKFRFSLVGSKPALDTHFGKFAVLLEPVKQGKIGLACISGGVPVKIDVEKPWHDRADVKDDDPTSLASGTNGSAHILWKETGTGVKWAIVKIGLLFRTDFWAKLTNAAPYGANQWKYTFVEVIKKTDEYGGWIEKPNGRGGSAYNSVEDPNDGSGEEGNGVDLSSLDNPEMWPAGKDAIVRMTEVRYGDGAEPLIEYWFQFENQVTFNCDCSSCSCSCCCSSHG